MRHNNDAMEQQVINILQECSVDGLLVKLPAGQLDRKLYQVVAEQLQLIGGKWKGGKTPIYRIVENKEDSTLWKMHMNSFNHKDTGLPEEVVRVESAMPIPEYPVVITTQRKGSKKQSNILQLELF